LRIPQDDTNDNNDTTDQEKLLEFARLADQAPFSFFFFFFYFFFLSSTTTTTPPTRSTCSSWRAWPTRHPCLMSALYVKVGARQPGKG
jgi:hypothetical protein